ncbi:MAG: hypothetical protein ACREQJ_10000 [Candidatus Binatia bacterium]
MLDVLNRDALAPGIVLFGSSVIASGIDTEQLSSALPAKPLVLNLATAQQSLTESYLFYQELPSSVRVVVQALTARELMNRPQLDSHKFNAFYMYGYRPDARTRDFLQALLGDDVSSTLALSDAQQRFAARWSVHRLLDTGQWRLRTNLPDMDRWATDIFFSGLFQTRLPPADFERTLEWWLSTWTAPDPGIVETIRRLLREMASRQASRNGRLIVFVPPVYPAVTAHVPEAFETELRSVLDDARSAGAEVIDASRLLPEESFRDCIHVLHGNAPRLTQQIAERIRSGDEG